MPDELLSRAMVAFLDGSRKPYPSEDEEALCKAVGADAALDLLPKLRAILTEVFDTSIEWIGYTYEPFVRVQDEVRRNHPELTEQAVVAVGRYWSWCMK